MGYGMVVCMNARSAARMIHAKKMYVTSFTRVSFGNEGHGAVAIEQLAIA